MNLQQQYSSKTRPSNNHWPWLVVAMPILCMLSFGAGAFYIAPTYVNTGRGVTAKIVECGSEYCIIPEIPAPPGNHVTMISLDGSTCEPEWKVMLVAHLRVVPMGTRGHGVLRVNALRTRCRQGPITLYARTKEGVRYAVVTVPDGMGTPYE